MDKANFASIILAIQQFWIAQCPECYFKEKSVAAINKSIFVFLGFFCLQNESIANTSIIPPFESTVSMSLDTIRSSDPTAFLCLEYIGLKPHTVWDKRTDDEYNKKMYVFNMHFKDQNSIPVVISRELQSVDAAAKLAYPAAVALGRILPSMRLDIGRLAIHPGNAGFHAGGYTDTKGQIVLYQDTLKARLKQKHLEESLFHEAVHASWDRKITNSTTWREVQRSDRNFITSYARERGEDLAESALLALGDYNNRLPEDIRKTLHALIPNKTQFIKDYIKYLSQNAQAQPQGVAPCE